jgi:hypothetical protein
VALDPWREETHRQLMRLYVLNGERSAALSQYESCRRLLQQELAVEPGAETTTLYEQIRDATDLAPLSTTQLALPAVRNHNLPASPTGFVGREAELAEIGGLLNGDSCRLLTLTGPGGSGKTRLALQAAAEQVDTFVDGVYFVALASLNSAALLVNSIADALPIELSTVGDPKAALLSWLQDKEILLVLDNFEQLLDGACVVADMVEHAPNLCLLVTSRERLNLQAEWVLPVTGLPVSVKPASNMNGVMNVKQVDYYTEQNTILNRTMLSNSLCRAHDVFIPILSLRQRMGRALPKFVTRWLACPWRLNWQPVGCVSSLAQKLPWKSNAASAF